MPQQFPTPLSARETSGVPPQPLPEVHLPDATLVELGRQGDTHALDILFRRHIALFLRRAESLSGNASDAQDICQEVCCNAIAKLGSLRDPEAFCPWVLRSIVNRTTDAKKRSDKIHFVETPLDEVSSLIIGTVTIGATVESAECLDEALATLWRDARGTRPPHREIALFMLHYFEQEQHVPAARTIAHATHTSRCTAYRCRKTILDRWRHVLIRLGLHP